jgi:DNA/RNA-binding domain of Phe-tRNA-synthetase-like protein
LEIKIASTVSQECPGLTLGILSSKIIVKSQYADLLSLIQQESDELSSRLAIEDISKLPAISAGRKGYKALGKDPARYRLSAEALLRRVINGKGLYQINNVVDALNLVSIKSGISIGGYNVDHIKGTIVLDVGQANEPYEAIGRGHLNMEFMPLLRDELGAFGSPTSDSTRTMVSNDTSHFLMVFFSFAGPDSHRDNGLDSAITYAEKLLQEYAEGKTLLKSIVSNP